MSSHIVHGHVLVIMEPESGQGPFDEPELWEVRCPHPTESVPWTAYGWDDGAEEHGTVERHLSRHDCTQLVCDADRWLHQHGDSCPRLGCSLINYAGETGWYLFEHLGCLPPGEYPIEWRWECDSLHDECELDVRLATPQAAE